MIFAIIIPTRNEKINLEKLLPALIEFYPSCPIWVVDDNSADGTENFVNEFSKKIPFVHILNRINQRGRGSAVLDGLKEAYKDTKISYFLEIDADGSHDPQEIKNLLSVAGSNTLVIGSRHISGSKFVDCSPIRMILSHLANFYARLILGVPINDYTNGFRLYSRSAIELLKDAKIHEKGYITLSETAYILYKLGFLFKEVPTIFVNRKIGRSNATIFEFLHSIPAIIRIRLNH